MAWPTNTDWANPQLIQSDRNRVISEQQDIEMRRRAMEDQLLQRQADMNRAPKPPSMITNIEDVKGNYSADDARASVNALVGDMSNAQKLNDGVPSQSLQDNAAKFLEKEGVKTTQQSVNSFTPNELPPPQSLYDIIADEKWQQKMQQDVMQLHSFIDPQMKAAFTNGSDDVRAAAVKQYDNLYEKTGNPYAKKAADFYRNVKFTGGEGFEYKDKVTKQVKNYLLSKAKTQDEHERINLIEEGTYKDVSRDKTGKLIIKDYAPSGDSHRDTNTLEAQTPEELQAYFEKNKSNMTAQAAISMQSIIEAQKRKKLNERKTNVLLKTNPQGKIEGVELRSEPAPIKVSVNVPAGGRFTGKIGMFKDSDYERYYTNGEKLDARPIQLQNNRTANQQALANFAAGYDDWLQRQGYTASDSGLHRSEVKGNKKALETVIQMDHSIGAFEKGAKNAMDITDGIQKEVSRGKYPPFNKLSLFVRQNAGNPNIKAFKNSLVTAMTEYMKVVTAGTNISSKELSVGAQQRAESLLETSDNFATFKKQFETFEAEMKGKKKSIKDERSEIEKELKLGGDKKKDEEKGKLQKKYKGKDGKEYPVTEIDRANRKYKLSDGTIDSY